MLAGVALLARAYQGGAVSVVYPVSRDVAPVLVLCFGAVVLAEHAGAVQVAGVAGVSLGVLLAAGVGDIVSESRSESSPHSRDLAFGLAIALVIAASTLVDAEGVDRARAPAYLFLLLAPAAVIYAAALAAARLRERVDRRRLGGAAAVVAGVAASAPG